MILGPIGFTSPLLLWALLALPLLWLILRAVPPAPIRRRFPGVALLLGLKDEDHVSHRTPWWLLFLRMLAVAAVIAGLAGPILNPSTERIPRTGPLLLVMDGGWAGAQDWAQRGELADKLLAEASRAGRTAAVMRLTQPEPPEFLAAEVWRGRMPGLAPLPWSPDATAIEALPDGNFETLWLSDGKAFQGQDALLAALEARGPVRVYQGARPAMALRPATVEGDALRLTAARLLPGPAREITVTAHGLDPAGTPRILASLPLTFEDGATEATNLLSLPAELRARVTRFEIEGLRSAGAITLSDDSLRRREVALIAGRDDREGLELLSPLHYLRKALAPSVDLIEGAITDVLPANPDVIVLADVATLSGAEQSGLIEWAEKGGLLLRFAGTRLAASDVSRQSEDPLLPVRLRAGGRTVGGAMSWGEPKGLAPFTETSPFFGLPVPEDVRVSAQVLAQPDPTLAERVIAQLADGTPLITRKRIGQGQVVLIHVTANAEWSTLPISGLFVQVLQRLAVSSSTTQPAPEDLAGTVWQAAEVMDAYGRLSDAGTLPGVAGETLLSAPLGPDLRPGLYQGEERSLARNAFGAEERLDPITWPARIPVEGLARAAETPLTGYLLALALLALVADVVASLALSGRLRAARALAPLLLVVFLPREPLAQTTDDAFALAATEETVLAHVLTGDRALDRMAQEGLQGLSDVLFFRTSVEPGTPIGLDLETDEIALFPFLYWPVSPNQPAPSAEAYAKLNRYLRAGGMILFDARDADVAGFGSASPNGRKLQALAAPLDIPPLEPLPQDHVLTRTFYLLQDFPGRYASRDVWVEAAPPGAEQVEGMPFRNLNDGVTPVVIGGNDWAAAWASDDRGNPIYPVGRGLSGERQRELAYRFGVNLVMHVLTGNYKSDQVHVPALLERLGQ
ncbi:MAG: DUF4159 domain-containing protein [Rhodobacteraceae bacterium]|nr:DUF4159 domain-containing protein [Paracoccaceae bacterium]